MKAKVIDNTEQFRQQQQQPPRLEDTPQYKEALVNVTNDLLGEATGNLGDARARVVLYEQSLRQLQAQLHALQEQGKQQADPAETAKLERRLEAETQERQTLEAQLNSMRRHRDEVQRELDQARQAVAKQTHAIAELEDRAEGKAAESKSLQGDLAAALGLVADIRAAAGDPEGELTQDALIKHIENLVANQKKPRKKAAPKEKAESKKKKK